MSEVVEIYKELRQRQQQKRRNNLQYSTELLAEKGVPFVAHNGGVHLVVRAGAELVDFWPSTGLWTVRGHATRNRGVRGLLAYVRQRANPTNANQQHQPTHASQIETRPQPVPAL